MRFALLLYSLVLVSWTAATWAEQSPSLRAQGVFGDGQHDDTAALQRILNAAAEAKTPLQIPAGHYLIDTSKGLTLPSHSRVELAPDAVFRAIPNALDHSRILKIEQVSDVQISGGQIEGDRRQHQGQTGEWGHGIDIRASRHIMIRSTIIRQCWGDGIYIGKDSQDVQIVDVSCRENRRQGLSVTSGSQILIQGCTFEKTSGTAPACGVDIEPNRGESVTSCTILKCRFLSNAGGGIQAGPASRDQGKAFVKDLRIEDCTLEGNGEGQPPRYAVHVSLCENTRVLRNQLRDNLGIGIGVSGSRETEIRGNTVSRTRLTSNRSDAGILLTRDERSTVEDNVISDNDGYGIFLWKSQTATDKNTLSGNARGSVYR